MTLAIVYKLMLDRGWWLFLQMLFPRFALSCHSSTVVKTLHSNDVGSRINCHEIPFQQVNVLKLLVIIIYNCIKYN